MAKRTTRAAAGAQRPAVDKKTRQTAVGKASAARVVAEPGIEVARRAKGKAVVGATTEAAKTKAKSTSAKVKKPSDKTSAKARDATIGRRSTPTHATEATARAAAPKRRAKARSTKAAPPPYLAAELGQPVDHEGEPIGAGSRAAFSDTELQRYTLQLWQQMQARRGVSLQLPAMERAGVTIDQIWTAGVTDRLTTSSTADDVRRYRQKLLFRANLLESILTETVSELNRLSSIEPAPSRSLDEPG